VWGLKESAYEPGPVLATIVLGVIGTGVAFAIMASLVGRVGSTRASFITYLIPFVSLALGVVFLGDEVQALAIVGVVLVVAGAFLASRRR
jgi:drug/metabolite transporter (DMT)-like permease